MPMKTVDNRTNVPPLDHVGVINETAKLACEESHTWGTPSVIQHSWLIKICLFNPTSKYLRSRMVGRNTFANKTKEKISTNELYR